MKRTATKEQTMQTGTILVTHAVPGTGFQQKAKKGTTVTILSASDTHYTVDYGRGKTGTIRRDLLRVAA